MEQNLDYLRNEIDKIDNEMLDLFYKRMDVCLKVAEYKRKNNLEIFQGEREKVILDKVRKRSPEEFEEASVAFISSIMEISKALQQKENFSNMKFIDYNDYEIKRTDKVGCPGTIGSNSETATLKMFDKDNIEYFADFEDICKGITDGTLRCGILPIHNTTAGSVLQTYNLLEKYNLYINTTTKILVDNCIATRKNVRREDIKVVYSHPQALSQCSNFIKYHGLKPVQYANTALAAEMVSKSNDPIAAICSESCAEEYGLKILKKNINNASPNYTKFICITKDCQLRDDADTISVLLNIPNICGSLYKLLAKFSVNSLNILKLESIPLKDGSFDVSFYIEFEGNINDKIVSSLLFDLKNNTKKIKFLGNYKEI